MKRFACIAIVIVLALVYHTQASANDLDGTFWIINVFTFDAHTGQLLFSYYDYLHFDGGQLQTYWGGWAWTSYGVYTGTPHLSWSAVVDDIVWGLTRFDGVMFYNMIYGVIDAPEAGYYCSFYGFPATPQSVYL